MEQQLQRKELKGQLNTRTEEALKTKGPKYLSLKKKIGEFAITSKHPTVLALKEEFQTEGQGWIDEVSWATSRWKDSLMNRFSAWKILGREASYWDSLGERVLDVGTSGRKLLGVEDPRKRSFLVGEPR